VLVAAVLVVVFGGLFLSVVFLRNVRATLRTERRND
jgi:ABC-type thiamin/hydroxymethylpyrimidine transport system permease subunit